jgi:hypothetical protein
MAVTVSPAVSFEEAVNHARLRREELQQQEEEAVERIGACLDEFLARLAAINTVKHTGPLTTDARTV